MFVYKKLVCRLGSVVGSFDVHVFSAREGHGAAHVTDPRLRGLCRHYSDL